MKIVPVPHLEALYLTVLLLISQSAISAPKPRIDGIANVNGTHMHYEVYGKGSPVVFLHAGLADSRMWDLQTEYFSHRYTVIRFDARGYGKSDPATAPYAPADDLFALLSFLHMNRAAVVGLSMGGTEAIDFALAHPQAVSALVVIAGSPGWMPYSDALIRRTSAILANVKEKGPDSIVKGWLNDPMLAAARQQPKVEHAMQLFLTQNTAGILNSAFMRPPEIPAPKLSDINLPTMIVVGDEDDPEIVERVHVMARGITGAEEVVIQGAGHMVNLERPREFNRVLYRFLASVVRN